MWVDQQGVLIELHKKIYLKKKKTEGPLIFPKGFERYEGLAQEGFPASLMNIKSSKI